MEFLWEQLSSRPESSYSGSMKPLHRTFWHVKVGDVDRNSPLFIYDPIKGIMRIHSICATNKNNLTHLWKIWCVFVISIWTDARLNAKMSNGQANGCQNNFNLKILTMCRKQCMKVWMEIGNMGYKVCLQTHYCSCNCGLLAWFLLFHSFLFVIVFIILIYGHAGDELAVVLKVGDNFRVNAKERNDEGVTF